MIRTMLQNLSLRAKLTGIILAVTLFAVGVTLAVVVVTDLGRVRQALQENAMVLTRAVGDSSVSALAFGDKTAAQEILVRLASSPEVISAVLYDTQGKLFAAYGTPKEKRSSLVPSQTPSIKFDGEQLTVRQPIMYRTVNYGTVVLDMSTRSLDEKIRNYVGGVLALLIAVAVLAFALARRLQQFISGPLLRLAETAQQISSKADYSVRVKHDANDEIGTLYTGFNTMLEQIAERDRARDRAETQLFHEKEHAQVTLQSIGDGVVTTDAQGHIVFANAVAESLLGWRAAELQGRLFSDVFYLVSEFTGERITDPSEQCMREGQPIKIAGNTLLIDRNGVEVAIEDSAAPIRDLSGDIIGAVVVFHDVSEARALRRQLTFQASHDALTGVLNRTAFEKRLSEALRSARADGETHVMIYFDLDQFKVVNDTSGHVAGDELLRQVTVVLQRRLRDGDTFARLGGDEFGVLLERCEPKDALRVAENLRRTIHEFRFAWKDRFFDIGISIGVVNIGRDIDNVSQIMAAADIACYAAKDLGRNRIHVYSPDDAELALRHTEMHWVSRIQRALTEKRLQLYSQSILSLNSGHEPRLQSEILVRMLDENGHLIPPGAFIPAAERYSLMPAIDRWVISHLADHIEHNGMSLLGNESGVISINLSGMSMGDDDLVRLIADNVRTGRLPGKRLCFEITETAAIARLPAALHFMRELRQLGCQFALDDFGSGLSSFGYLRDLPVDYLKIDGSFVRRIGETATDREIVKMINQLGHAMGKQTVAESVESNAILSQLRNIGVDYAQGFAVSRPAPLREIN